MRRSLRAGLLVAVVGWLLAMAIVASAGEQVTVGGEYLPWQGPPGDRPTFVGPEDPQYVFGGLSTHGAPCDGSVATPLTNELQFVFDLAGGPVQGTGILVFQCAPFPQCGVETRQVDMVYEGTYDPAARLLSGTVTRTVPGYDSWAYDPPDEGGESDPFTGCWEVTRDAAVFAPEFWEVALAESEQPSEGSHLASPGGRPGAPFRLGGFDAPRPAASDTEAPGADIDLIEEGAATTSQPSGNGVPRWLIASGAMMFLLVVLYFVLVVGRASERPAAVRDVVTEALLSPWSRGGGKGEPSPAGVRAQQRGQAPKTVPSGEPLQTKALLRETEARIGNQTIPVKPGEYPAGHTERGWTSLRVPSAAGGERWVWVPPDTTRPVPEPASRDRSRPVSAQRTVFVREGVKVFRRKQGGNLELIRTVPQGGLHGIRGRPEGGITPIFDTDGGLQGWVDTKDLRPRRRGFFQRLRHAISR